MQFAVEVYREGRLALRGPYSSRQVAQAIFAEQIVEMYSVREPCGAAIVRWPPVFLSHLEPADSHRTAA